MPIKRQADGIALSVRLTPKASANRIQGLFELPDGARSLKCQVTAVPEAGKANAALIKMLAKAFKCPKTSLNIISGMTDRNKVVTVSGDPVMLERMVRTVLLGAQSGKNSD